MRRVRQSLPAETRLKSSPNPDWASLPKAQTARHTSPRHQEGDRSSNRGIVEKRNTTKSSKGKVGLDRNRQLLTADNLITRF